MYGLREIISKEVLCYVTLVLLDDCRNEDVARNTFLAKCCKYVFHDLAYLPYLIGHYHA